MKKIIIILFLFCPILGFFRATFFSDDAAKYINFSKNHSYVQMISYPKQGIYKGLSVDSRLIYKTPRIKNPIILELNERGGLERTVIAEPLQIEEAELILDLKGIQAEKTLHSIEIALKKYPFLEEELHLIGPNNNTLNAFILRKLGSDKELPSNAMGKDYIGSGLKWLFNASKESFIISFSGYVAFIASKEKIRLSLLGLSLGYDWHDEIIYLPGFGDLYLADLRNFFRLKNSG